MSDIQDWFYLDGENPRGPFNGSAMAQLFQSGIIGPDTLVARHGENEWSAVQSSARFEDIAGAPERSLAAATTAERGVAMKSLGIAVGALVLFFAANYWAGTTVYELTTPDPEVVSSASDKLFQNIVLLTLFAAAPTAFKLWVQTQVKVGAKKKSKRSGLAFLSASALFVTCAYIALFPDSTKGVYGIAWLFLQGAIGSGTLGKYVILYLLVIGSATFASEKIRPRLSQLRTAGSKTPWVLTVTRSVAITAAVLAILSLLRLAIPLFFVSKKDAQGAASAGQSASPEVDLEDVRKVNGIILMLRAHQQRESGSLGDLWQKISPTVSEESQVFGPSYDHTFDPEGDNHTISGGDHRGQLAGRLLQSISLDSVEYQRGSAFRDNQGDYFNIIVDGNADGKVSWGDSIFDGQAMVFSCGKSLESSSDDVVQFLK